MHVPRFRPEIASDLKDAIRYYESKRIGLGNEFLNEFWRALDRLSENPLLYSIASTGLRACRIERFPYVIHYRFDEEEFIVFAVMFGGRDTKAWRERV